MPKWVIFNASLFLNEHEHPPFLFQKFPYDKYSVDKVWTKVYCQFYFRGMTLRTFARTFSNIDFFLKLLPVKVDELGMSEM